MAFRGRGTVLIAEGAPTASIQVADPFVTGGAGVAADAEHQHAFPAADLVAALSPGGAADVSAVFAQVDDLVFNVRHYGAVGDGVANDSAAAAAAIADAVAAGGGVVYYPPGVYSLAGVSTPSEVTSMGAGRLATRCVARTSGQGVFRIAAAADNVEFSHMTIDGNRAVLGTGSAASALGGSGGATNVVFDHVTVTSGQGFSVFLNSAGGTTYSQCRFLHSTFTDSGGGWDTFGSGALQDSSFIGCTFRNSSGQGWACTEADGVTVIGCQFIGPMGNGISLEPGRNVTVMGCRFRDLNDNAIGVTINPGDGTHAFNPSAVTVTGCRFYNTAGSESTGTGTAVFVQNSTDIIITNNLVVGMGRAGFLLAAQVVNSVAGTVQGVTIANNIVRNVNYDNAASRVPIVIQTDATCTTDSVRVLDNDLRRTDTTNAHSAYAIQETNGPTTNCEYRGNDVRGHATAGILVNAGSTNPQLRNNPGLNPQGTAVPAVGASPWTYTAGNTPEVLYLRGGTVSLVAKDGNNVAVASPCAVPLEPGESVTVTYSLIPTAIKDRK